MGGGGGGGGGGGAESRNGKKLILPALFISKAHPHGALEPPLAIRYSEAEQLGEITLIQDVPKL